MNSQNICKKIIELKQNSESGLLDIAELLYYLEKNKAWEQMGHKDWTALVTSQEDDGGLEMDKHTVSKLMGVYDHYIVGAVATLQQLKDLHQGPFKLYEARDIINTQDDLKLLELPLSEIKMIKRQQGKSVESLQGCDHVNIKVKYFCPDCNAWFDELPNKDAIVKEIEKIIMDNYTVGNTNEAVKKIMKLL